MNDWSWRCSTFVAICKRECWEHLRSMWFYVIAALALFIGGFLVTSYLEYMVENGMMVAANPLYPPLYITAIVTAGCAGLWAAFVVAAERERGTLVVLFFGPVDALGYLIGKFGGLFLVYLILTVVNCIFLVGASWLSGLALPVGFAWLVLLLLGSGAAAIAFGLYLSCLSGRLRGAISLYLACITLWGVLAALPTFLSVGVLSASASATEILLGVIGAVDWLSPFSYLGRGLEGMLIASPGIFALNLAFVIVYAVVALSLAVTSLNRKGVVNS